MKTANLDLFITPSEVAELMGITVQGLYKQLRELNISTETTDNGRYKIYPAAMRQYIETRGLRIPKSVIALHIVKGGVGKTTLAHALASRASVYGFKTLMVDLDQQSNLSTSFGVYSNPKENYNILQVAQRRLTDNPIDIKDTIVPLTSHLHLIPANIALANFDPWLTVALENLQTLFKNIFDPIIHDYDLIFIDCPPALSKVTAAVHCFADQVILPVNADKYSIDGLETSLDHFSDLNKSYKVDCTLNIVVNKLDLRQRLLRDAVLDTLRNNYQEHLMHQSIGISKQIDNSIAKGECIWAAKPSKNPILEDFNNLLIELLELDQWNSSKDNSAPKTTQEELMHV